MGKYFYNDYSDTIIEKKEHKNSCGDIITTEYLLKIAKYRLGIKSYFYFYEWSCGMEDCYKSRVYKSSIEDLMKEFKKLKMSVISTQEKINVCQ